MTAIVDALPFPWDRPEARELHIALCELYPTSRSILWVVGSVGMNTLMINPDEPPFFVWVEVLNMAARTGSNRQLVGFVVEQNPRSPKAGFLQAILDEQGEPIESDYQPRAADGSPEFYRDSDQVSEQEALLFHDDLTLEFGRIPWLVGVLTRLRELGASVCKLSARNDGFRQAGTGFRIGTDLLLTNWHIVHFRSLATQMTAEFGYEDDGAGGTLATMAIPCDTSTIKGDAEFDWAVVRCAQPLPDTVPIINLARAAEPRERSPAFIIQHPAGERKRIAFVRNQVTDVDDKVLHYLSDTQQGSSGSPVFDDQGRLIGLHHAGGRPQEVAGRLPMRKNEGIRIPQILAGLSRMEVDVA